MVRKVVFRAHAGQCGTDIAQGYIYPDSVTDAQLSEEAWQFGLDHAAMYGIYPTDEMPEDYDEDSEDAGWCSDTYSDGIEGWWEEYNPEEHDSIITYGNYDEPQFHNLT